MVVINMVNNEALRPIKKMGKFTYSINNIKKTVDHKFNHCPNCDKRLLGKYNRCPCCSQSLDWNE